MRGGDARGRRTASCSGAGGVVRQRGCESTKQRMLPHAEGADGVPGVGDLCNDGSSCARDKVLWARARAHPPSVRRPRRRRGGLRRAGTGAGPATRPRRHRGGLRRAGADAGPATRPHASNKFSRCALSCVGPRLHPARRGSRRRPRPVGDAPDPDVDVVAQVLALDGRQGERRARGCADGSCVSRRRAHARRNGTDFSSVLENVLFLLLWWRRWCGRAVRRRDGVQVTWGRRG